MAEKKAPQVFKAQHSKGVIVGAVVLGVLVIAAIIIATTYMVRTMEDARLSGTVIEKNFVPKPPETQITIGRDGVTARERDGDYQVKVRVPMRDGTTEEFVVSNLARDRWETINVGDSFDVGPYLVGPVRGEVAPSSE